MTFVKFNPVFPAVARELDQAVNEFFNRPVGSLFKENNIPFTIPAVNIEEGENGYFLSLAAPGLEKEDFSIDLDKRVLTISVNKELSNELADEEAPVVEKKFTRKDFSFSKFKHAFNLPEEVDLTKIGAEYVKGILELSLPRKKSEVLKTKQIEVK